MTGQGPAELCAVPADGGEGDKREHPRHRDGFSHHVVIASLHMRTGAVREEASVRPVLVPCYPLRVRRNHT